MLLEDGDVMAVVEDLAREFDWDVSLRDLVPMDRWHSKTSSFFRARPPDGGPGVVLKVGTDWGPDDARSIYEQLLSLQDLFRASGLEISAPAVLGWHQNPPSVCMEYIEGEDLDEILDRRSGYTSPAAERAVEECGSLLGLFHSSSEPGASEAGRHEKEARDRLRSMADQLRISPTLLESMDLGELIKHRYGDFAPYNVRMAATGRAWLLDQPAPRSFAVVHRDVSWYSFALLRNVGREDRANSAEVEAARNRLVAAFLAGYARTGPCPLSSPEDEALLALHYAHSFFWAAKRRWRQRRYGEVPRHLRLALRWRRSALRAL